MPNTPTIGELLTLNAQQQKWVDRLETILGAGRIIVTTPGVLKERVQFLQSILNQILMDNEFRKQAEKLKLPIDYLTGEDAKKNVTKLLSAPENEAKEINHVLLSKYLIQ